METRKIWKLVPIEECWRRTGRPPIGTRWGDTNKGSEDFPDVRCRLVARDFKEKRDKEREDLFAATPPVEAERMALSRAATKSWRKDGVRRIRKVMFIDAKKAHLNPPCDTDVYIYLPAEANAPEGMCGKLVHWLYGCRPAAQAWENFYAGKLEAVGFVRGDACGVVIYHPVRDVSCVCPGDVFLLVGEEVDLKWISEEMAKWFEIKVRAVLGPEEKDDKEVRMLNRYVRLVNLPDGEFQVEYEADPRHAELISKQLNLERANSVVTPGVKLKSGDLQNYSTPLPPSAASVFRSLTMRACYLAQDRADLAFSAKECARMMSQPTELGWTALKRIGRFLLGKPRVVQVFKPQCKPSALFIVASDTDHAGCLRTRKGTSGTILLHGDHCLKATSSTHTYPALSSGEDEYYGVVKAASTGLGAVAMAADFNQKKGLKIQTDSTAAKGIGTRRGLGKTRHIETRSLWVQHKIANGDLMLEKIRGTVNVAGLLTKHVDAKTCEKYMTMIGQEYRPGRLRNAKRIIGSRGPVDPTLHYLDPES